MDFKSKVNPQNINYLLKRLIHGRGDIADIADERIEIYPSTNSFVQPSHFFENELQNILKYHPETTQKIEMLRIKGGPVVHQATICWQINNAYISDNAIYKKNFKKIFPKCISPEKKVLVNNDELALVSSYQGIKYFGHWLRDDVITYIAAKQFGQPINFPTPSWPDKRIYSDVFDQCWNQHYLGKIKTLSIFQDFAQNDYRLERYKQLRSLVRAKYNSAKNNGYIYLKRGLTGANVRNLVNEEKLIETLEKYNFTILDITQHSLEYLIENLLDAKLVITLEGSHQNHVLYTLADSGSLIILQPPNLFNNSAKDWCNVLGFKHGLSICKATEEGFVVNIETIIKLIEFMRV